MTRRSTSWRCAASSNQARRACWPPRLSRPLGSGRRLRRCHPTRTRPTQTQTTQLGVRRSSLGKVTAVEGRKAVLGWPVFRQLTGADLLGRGASVQSRGTREHVARTETADRVVRSVCPYCAVGCGQRVYVKDDRVVQIEGDVDSPVSRGRLCPKGAASEQLVNSPGRQTKVLYRRPYGTEWEPLDLETAMDMIADRVIDTRSRTWQERDDNGALLRRTLGIAGLGGATLDNEENYLIKKLFT